MQRKYPWEDIVNGRPFDCPFDLSNQKIIHKKRCSIRNSAAAKKIAVNIHANHDKKCLTISFAGWQNVVNKSNEKFPIAQN